MLDNEIRIIAITQVHQISAVRALTLEQVDADGQSYTLVWLLEQADGGWYLVATEPLGELSHDPPVRTKRVSAEVGCELFRLSSQIPPAIVFPLADDSVTEAVDGSVYFLSIRSLTQARAIVADACFLEGLGKAAGAFPSGPYAKYAKAIIQTIERLKRAAAEKADEP